METPATPPERLRLVIRSRFRGKTKQLATLLGMTEQSLNNYLPHTGKRIKEGAKAKRVVKLGDGKLKLLEKLGINPDWYLTGEGEMMLNIKEVSNVTEIPTDKLYNIEIYDLPAHANIGSLASFYDLPVSTRKLGVVMGVKEENLKGIRVSGDSMKDAHIYNGDLVLYDTSLEPRNNMQVICVLNGTVLIKTYLKNDNIELHSAYNGIPPIIVKEIDDDFNVLGIVKAVVSQR